MLLMTLLTNMLTSSLLLYHIYTFHKLKKHKLHSDYKTYPYVFILFACLLSIETMFRTFLNYVPFYTFFKFLFIVIVGLPYTNMPFMIYKEYIQRPCNALEIDVDENILKIWCILNSKFSDVFRIIRETYGKRKQVAIPLQNICVEEENNEKRENEITD